MTREADQATSGSKTLARLKPDEVRDLTRLVHVGDDSTGSDKDQEIESLAIFRAEHLHHGPLETDHLGNRVVRRIRSEDAEAIPLEVSEFAHLDGSAIVLKFTIDAVLQALISVDRSMKQQRCRENAPSDGNEYGAERNLGHVSPPG
jgi:hypothetical protein